MTQPNMMQRLIRYCQGLFGVKMNQTEIGRTDIVYHNAIRDRVKQHHDLKTALSRLIILHNRADARGLSFQEDLGVVEAALQTAAKEGDEERGIELLDKRNNLQTAIKTSSVESIGFTQQIDSAKEGLQKLAQSITELKSEQAKMEARRKHAQARIQASQALQSHMKVGVDETALGRVRDAVEELEAKAGLVEEPVTEPQESLSISNLRKEQEKEKARLEFRAMQKKESTKLLVAPNFKAPLGIQLQEVQS
jgi:phage shock protein A